MRIALTLVLLLVTAASAGAEDPRSAAGSAGTDAARSRRRGDVATDLFIEMPLQYDTRVVFPFGGSHHAVPGVVAINKAPYFCRAHDLSFHTRAAFVEHLSVKHGLTDREIPSMVLVDHNQVRYVGD